MAMAAAATSSQQQDDDDVDEFGPQLISKLQVCRCYLFLKIYLLASYICI
jgi:hypothetical protein